MNCKPGDLAIIISGVPANYGGLVEVLRRCHSLPGNWWEVKTLSRLTDYYGGFHPPGTLGGIVQDAVLRPLPRNPDAMGIPARLDAALPWR
jgi:hypothetical protein